MAHGQALKPKPAEEMYPFREYPAANDVKPLPLMPIPVDPPPHEGAFFDIPYIIEPPDLLIVEVLEALPGRPISGERLVRPDGTVDLGFYGEVHVRGLTREQAKVKIVEHLRQYLDHETLGLTVPDAASEGNKHGGADERGEAEIRSRPSNGPETKPSEKPRSASVDPEAANGLRLGNRLFRRPSPGAAPRFNSPAKDPSDPDQQPASERPRSTVRLLHIAPAETDRVFVDVTAYNSKYYFVDGDVTVAGKMPITGNDTVLDAIQYAGGFIPSANSKDIRLIRPARGGKPARVYNIDYDAIVHAGNARANLQLFPGDRLFIGRNALVQSTMGADQVAGLAQTTINTIHQLSIMARALTTATPDLTPVQREALAKDWFELFWKATQKPGGPLPDEATYREMFLRLLKPAAHPEAKK
jgi:protein involved in polysaccharide export with SLBB domain